MITEEKLMKEWSDKRSNFIQDGIVCPTKYYNNKIKVLYILKEVNGKKGKWDFLSFLRNGGHWKTWNNIVRWQYGFENIDGYENNNYNDIEKVYNHKRKNYLQKVAIINLKKEPGGSSSNMKEIEQYCEEDKELIQKQIELYEPNIIIGCGVGYLIKSKNLLKNLSEWKVTSNNVKYAINNKNLIVIRYYHPQVRKSKKDLYNNLMIAYKEIKNCKKENQSDNNCF